MGAWGKGLWSIRRFTDSVSRCHASLPSSMPPVNCTMPISTGSGDSKAIDPCLRLSTRYALMSMKERQASLLVLRNVKTVRLAARRESKPRRHHRQSDRRKGGWRSLLALRLLTPSGDPDRTSKRRNQAQPSGGKPKGPIEARKYWFDFQ